MTSIKNNWPRAKRSLPVLMRLAALTILALSACTSTIKQTPLSMQQTSDPRFLSYQGSTWVSAAEYQRLQHQVADLTTALNQLRAQSQVSPQ